MIKTSFETPFAPIGSRQRADEIEHHYDRIEIKEQLEQEGFVCTEHRSRFSIGTQADVKINVEDFPVGTLVVQPPLDETGSWQLISRLITNGQKVFVMGSEDGIDRVTDILQETELIIFCGNSNQKTIRLRLVPVQDYMVCGIKAVNEYEG